MSENRVINDVTSLQSEDLSNSQTSKISSLDKQEFAVRPLVSPMKSTTEIDSNSVLRSNNITVPNKIFIDNGSQKNTVAVAPITATVTATTATATTSVNSQIDNPINLRNVRDSDDNLKDGIITPRNFSSAVAARVPSSSKENTTISKIKKPSNKNTSLTFTLNNDKKLKRSSTYASKSTVTAIPIAQNKKGNGLNYTLNDENVSISRSSSMTTSLSRSFLFGFYHDNRKDKQSSRNVLSKEYWMKDESSKECFTCGKPFTTFRRKHHCRICGQIFCNSCTLQISAEKFGYSGNMRVCHNCFEQANNYEDSSDEDEDNIVDESGQMIDHSHSLLRNNTGNDYSDMLNRSVVSINQDTSNIDHQNEGSSSITKQNEIFLLNSDDVQSIMTSGEDSKLFISTPPPPPKMAIPATRQGESLEISFKDNIGRNKQIVSPNSNVNHGLPNVMKMVSPNNHPSYTRDIHNFREANLLRTPASSPFKNGAPLSSSDMSYYNQRHHPGYNIRNKHSASRLGRSIFNYVTSATSTPFDEKPVSSLHDDQQKPTVDHAKNIIENLTNKNFKFKFNYGQQTNTNRLNSIDAEHETPTKQNLSNMDETREDEGTMSIYSSLNGAVHSDNPIRSTRNSTRSFQRAEASLQRMRTRRRSKSKMGPSKIYRDINLLTHSTPNLLSVVSDNDTSDFALNDISNNKLISEEIGNNSSEQLNTDSFGSKLDKDIHGAQQAVPQSTPISLSSSMVLSNKHSSGKSSTFNQWKRLSSISGLRYHQGNKNMLNEVATLHFKELLIQVLNDQNIKEVDNWLTVLEDMALANIQNITLSARDSNTLDYRQKYVKIKRITGGAVTDSEYIDGIVFAKALPIKTMPRYVDNPRILLIMFPLEYQRNEN
ncbi:1-phosphatidylinositol-3-phosphate 5-kinase [Maudiozyma exigua]|uniref:1-phosphatidylinositol-3-phosphate 5-kinase n=1 Tax=Maudiozyma exigua TaxID=34358 RepID=A0A9P6W9N0_MAUEX|nr:1-phosphatidylinositol-3-phosphate 5-kinase [Kazachstania exigua]